LLAVTTCLPPASARIIRSAAGCSPPSVSTTTSTSSRSTIAAPSGDTRPGSIPARSACSGPRSIAATSRRSSPVAAVAPLPATILRATSPPILPIPSTATFTFRPTACSHSQPAALDRPSTACYLLHGLPVPEQGIRSLGGQAKCRAIRVERNSLARSGDHRDYHHYY